MLWKWLKELTICFYIPLYEKGIKENQNRPIETTTKYQAQLGFYLLKQSFKWILIILPLVSFDVMHRN